MTYLLLNLHQKIKETFGDRINIIIGDSTKTLQYMLHEQYDLIHIDGGHGKVYFPAYAGNAHPINDYYYFMLII